jgi:hypothetical protein
MVIKYFYPDLKHEGQLEDTLVKEVTAVWGKDSIYYHDKLVLLLKRYNVTSRFSTTTPFRAIKSNLDNGNPCIYSGRFTRGGHIIVIKGYNEEGFIVNDPWGEWTATGYLPRAGKDLVYSYGMLSRLSYSATNTGWCHLTSK